MKSYLTVFSIVILVLIALFLGIWKGSSMRREIPFQEIVPLDGGIAVINAGNWFISEFGISLRSEGQKVQQKKYDENGFCLFQGLSNGRTYTVELKRTDLKGRLLYKRLDARVVLSGNGSKYIILVGASVGKTWEFPRLSDRVSVRNDVVLGNRTIYAFDKDPAIDAITNLPIPISAVIIKECSAYFPREIDPSVIQIKQWISELRAKGIAPVLATVVPVTKQHDQTHPGRLESILAFNDDIRNYAEEEGISVLDLEKAVRVSASDRYLKNEYAQPDGNHLVKRAYEEALDKIGAELIENLVE